MAATIFVESQNKPLAKVNVLALLPNETYKSLQTDKNGEATPNLYDESLPITVFAAADGYEGVVKEKWIPAQGELKIELKAYPGGGSCIIDDASYQNGYIPGLSGSFTAFLNPRAGVQDSPIEVHTRNLAVNCKNPPDTFIRLGQDVELSDSDGVTVNMAIRAIVGKSVLFDWYPETPVYKGSLSQ